MNKVIVSVIMATYNCTNTLRASLDSILAQTFKDWEFIICDDCSTDDTFEILMEYQNMNPNQFVVLKNEKNSKLPYSLNKCLLNARGKYIARMDGDDISEPSRFEEQVKYLETHPEIAVVGTGMAQFDNNGIFGEIKVIEYPGQKHLLTSTPFCHATIMMRKEVYDAVENYTVAKRTIRGQDVDLWFKVFHKGYRGYNIPKPLYRVREDRAAIRRRKLKYRCYESITRIKGYKLLNFPLYCYVFAIFPIFSFFVPVSLKRYIRKIKTK